MPLSFKDTLVVGISSRALFDLEAENKLFQEKGVVAYRQYQKDREAVILLPGTGFYVVSALLNLNKLSDERLMVQ